jgi:molybdenum cofactor cytidylyltransferase
VTPAAREPLASRVAGLVLAAGESTRFGSPKALALIDARPMLEHVLDVAAAAELHLVVVVLGVAADEIERTVRWRGERRVRNPDPARGLSSSLRLGVEAIAAMDPPVATVVVLLGDQPRADAAVIRTLLERRQATDRPIVVPRYALGGGSNPVIVDRSVFDLVRTAAGDRGLGPLIAAYPELVEFVPVPGRNPDVDTPADLDRLDRRIRSPSASTDW